MNRADSAEVSIQRRYIRPVSHIPGTQLGVPTWPPRHEKSNWNYWWQAHLLDCMIDAQLRNPTTERLANIKRQIRSHWMRNAFHWTNAYYDDMAWLAIALDRAHRHFNIHDECGISPIKKQLMNAWSPELGGGIPWRKKDKFFNAPANGPAGIFLARSGEPERAWDIANWIHDTLIDPVTGLVFDGIHDDGRMETALYTYCQGVVLGLETELAKINPRGPHIERVVHLVRAVEMNMTHHRVIYGGGSGDGGLFEGILARYLGQVARELPGDSPSARDCRKVAKSIVLSSAESAWKYRLTFDKITIFPVDWSKYDQEPLHGHDLSVQLSGWMLMEAAHRLGNHS